MAPLSCDESDLSSEPAALRILLCLLLAFVAGLLVIGVTWGVEPGSGAAWAPDEVLPKSVYRAFRDRFSGGWYSAYPPFHYYVLTAAYVPGAALHYLGVVDLFENAHLLLYTGRVVSLLMAFGTLWVVYRCGAELFESALAGCLAALILGVTLPFPYYAKMANMDVPYLFWYGLSLLFLLKLLRDHELRDYLGFGVAAVLSITTKDQAAGLFLLLAPVIPIELARHRRGQKGFPPDRGATGLWRDRRIWLPLSVCVALALVIYNVPLNLSGIVEHVKLILGEKSQPYRIYEPTLSGQIAMLWQSGRHLLFMFGFPLAAICALAVLRQITRWKKREVWVFLLSVLSYYIFFISVTGINYVRFFLPVALVLSLLAGGWLAEELGPARRHRTLRLVLAAAVFVFSAVRVGIVDWRMLSDSRYAAQEWLRDNLDPSVPVLALGREHHLPHLEAFERTERTEAIGANPGLSRFEAIVTTSNVYPQDDQTRSLLRDLEEGLAPYACAWSSGDRHRLQSLVSLEGVFTNLDKLDPRIRIYRRVADGQPPSAC